TDSSTQPWLSELSPKFFPSVATSFAFASRASLFRIHQKTPAPTTPTTSSTTMIPTINRTLSQPDIRGDLQSNFSRGLTQMNADKKSNTYSQIHLFIRVHLR